MTMKRIGRILVCLLLVCCLIVNISPIRAEASAALGWQLVNIGAQNVVASMLRGLGVGPGDERDAFGQLVNDAITYLGDALGFVMDGVCTVLKYTTDVGVVGFHIDRDIIEALRTWLWDEDILLAPSTCMSYEYFNGSAIRIVFSNPCLVYCVGDSAHTLYFCSGNVYASYEWFNNGVLWGNGGTALHSNLGEGYFYEFATFDSSVNHNCNLLGSSASEGAITAMSLFNSDVSTSYDLSLSNVASSDMDFDTGYPTWAAGSVSVPGSTVGSTEEEEVYLPVGIGQTYDETVGMTQEQVQAGESTYVDTSTDTEAGTGTGTGTVTGTVAATPWATFTEWLDAKWTVISTGFSDVITGISDVFAGVKSLPEAIAAALSAVFVPSADYITVKVEALRANFGFIDSVITTAEFIRDSVSGASGPPAIYVDLSAAEGSTNWGGKVLLTDFAWYSKYKSTVDTWLSAALWAFFGWRVFLRLPGIISGESGYIGDVFAHREKVEKIKSGPPTGKKKE